MFGWILLIECVIELMFKVLIGMLFLIVCNVFCGVLNKINVFWLLKCLLFLVILIIWLIGIIWVCMFVGVVCLIMFECKLFLVILLEIIMIWVGLIVLF